MSNLKSSPALETLEAFKQSHPDRDTVGKILALSEAVFVETYVTAFDGDTRKARQAYREAQRIQELTTLLWANIKDTVASPHIQTTLFNNIPDTFLEHQGLIPGYDRLFGSLDFIDCEHCRSIFGPAAYFVDLLRFIERHIPQDDIKDETVNLPDHRLEARQPRLFRIPLDCENTFNLVPYIDLVIEVLEDVVRTGQTPDAYEVVEAAKFPMSLPFHLPLAEIRTYLDQLKLTLQEIYRLFGNHEPDVAREILALSPREYGLLANEIVSEADLNTFYGVDDVLATGPGSLADVAVFTEQTGLTRSELDTLLFLDLSADEVQIGLSRLSFINGTGDRQGPITIDDVAIPGGSDTYERINNLTLPKLERIYRFLKLARRLDWSFADLDWALRSLSSTSYTAETVLHFDGINDFVHIPDAADLRLATVDETPASTPELTLEAWVWLDGATNHTLLCKGNPESPFTQFLFWVTPQGQLGFYSYWLDSVDGEAVLDDRGNHPPMTGSPDINGPGLNLTSEGSVPLQRFTHVAVTVNAAATVDGTAYHQTRFYIDGVLDTTWSLPSPIPLEQMPEGETAATIRLGTHENRDFLAGSLSEVRLWNQVRTTEEIQRERLNRLRGTESGLLAYWPLINNPDGTIEDRVAGSPHPGYLGGTSHSARPRWIQRDLVLTPLPVALADTALRFNGRDDYLAAQGVPAIKLSDLTLEAWVSLEESESHGLLTWGDAVTGEIQLQWRLEAEAGNVFLVLSGAALSGEVRSDAIASEQFNPRLHIAVVVQATQVQFFVNGTLAGTQSKPATPFSPEGGDLYVGRGFDDVTYLHGTLQEVRLWRVARSVVDLQQTLHQQLTGAEAGLIGYWRLDSVTAQGTIPDLSFNHTDLTAGGILSVYQPQLTLHPEVLLPNPVEQVAQVLNFDAQHYGVTVINPQDYGLGHYEQFSLQLWFLATDPGATDRKQILLTQGDTETGLSLYLFGGELYVHAWCLDDGTLNQHTLKRSDIDANQWHQVSVVYDEIASRDGVSYRLYLDGTEADATDDGFRLDQVGPIHLGGLTAAVITRFDDGETVGNSHHFAGQLTDLRLWKTALSAEAITVPPDAQHPRHIAPTNHPDLLCYLPMTEGYGAPVGEHTGTRYAPTTDNPTLLTPVIYDQTPQGHHGNLVVGPDRVPGKWSAEPLPPIFPGTALSLRDGVLRLPDTATLNLLGTAFTVELWVQIASFELPLTLLQAGPAGLSLDVTGHLQVQLGSSLLTAAVPLEAGQWHHVAWRVEPDVHTLFIDGQPQGGQPHGAPLTDRVQWVLGGNFEGNLSELRIWNQAQSEVAIATQWNRRLQGDEPGLQGYWVFDTDPAQEWIDAVAALPVQLDTLADTLPDNDWVTVASAFPRQEIGLRLNQDVARPELIELNSLDLPATGTLELWVQFERTQTQTLFDASTSTSTFRLVLDSAQVLRLDIANLASETITAVLDLSGWPTEFDSQIHHLVVTWQTTPTTVLSLQLDDAVVYATAASGSGLPPLSPLALGLSQAGDLPYTGRFHQLRLWDHQRSQSQLQAAQRADLVGDEAGLLVYMPLDDGEGTRLNNLSASAALYAKVPPTPQESPQWVEADWAITLRGLDSGGLDSEGNSGDGRDNSRERVEDDAENSADADADAGAETGAETSTITHPGDYLDVASFTPGEQGTIELWAKFDPTREQILLDASNDEAVPNIPQKYFVLDVATEEQTPQLRFRLEDGADIDWTAAIDLTNLPAEFAQEWHHISIAWRYTPEAEDRAERVIGSLYLDQAQQSIIRAEEDDLDSVSGTVPVLKSLFVGQNRGDYRVVDNQPFQGELRQLRVWDRLLSGPEIFAIREIPLNGRATGLIIDLPIDEGSGTTLRNLVSPETPVELVRLVIPEIVPVDPGATPEDFWQLLDRAVVLNGVDQFIGLPEQLPWPSGSLAMRVKFTVGASDRKILLDASGNDSEDFFVIDLDGSQLRFWLDDPTVAAQIDLSEWVGVEASWHALFATWQVGADTTTLQLKFDHQPVATLQLDSGQPGARVRAPYVAMRRGEALMLPEYGAFAGEIKQLTLWQTVQPLDDLQETDITGTETGLAAALPIQAGTGSALENLGDRPPAQLYTRRLAVPLWAQIAPQLWQFGRSYGVLPTLSELGLIESDFTIETWVRLPETAGTQAILGMRGPIDPHSLDIWVLVVIDGQLALRMQGQGLQPTDLTLTADTWHRVAVRYRAGEVSLWLDGVASGDTLENIPPLTAAHRHLYVAHWRLAMGEGTWSDRDFTGLVDELRFWSTALGDDSLQATPVRRLRADTPDLTAVWRFDDDQRVRDRSHNHNPRILLGSPGVNRFEPAQPPIFIQGQVLALDGYNDYIDLGTPVVESSDAWTLAFWFYCHHTDGTQVLVSNVDLLTASVVDGCFQLEWLFQGSRSWEEAFFVTPATWVHVAIVYNGSELQIFHNGEPVGPARTESFRQDEASTLGLGAAAELQADRHFYGMMAQVELWAEARLASAIATTQSQALTGREPGLLGYWPILEAPGETLYDHTEYWPPAQLIAGLENPADKWQPSPPPIPEALSALVLDGYDDHVYLGDLAQFALEQGFTVAAWVRVEAPTSGAVFGSSTGDTETHGLCLGFVEGRPLAQLGSVVLQGDTPLDDQWHYVVWQYDATAGTLEISVDGTALTNTDAVLNFPETATAYIGRWQTWDDTPQQPVDHAFLGRIGDLRLWQGPRAIAAAATHDQRLVGNEPDLLAYWIFDDVHRVEIPAQLGQGNYQLILASTLTLQPPLWQTIETHPIWRQPLPQTALAFDGEHHFLALDGFLDGFTAQSNSFTIEAWINNTQADNETRPRQETPILWRGRAAETGLDGEFETDYELRITAEGQLAFYYGAAAPLLAPGTILVNRFTHVAVTVDDGDETTLRLWIDGDLAAETTETADLPNGGPILMAGRGNATGSVEFFRGLLQEVRLWSQALTEAELKESLHQPLNQPEQQSDLIGYWPLATLNDQGLTPDLSGQANPFRLGGLTTSRRPDIVALGTPTVGFLDPSALVLTLTREQAEALAAEQAETEAEEQAETEAEEQAETEEQPEVLPKTLPVPPFNAAVNPHRQQRTIEVWFQTENPLLARSQTIYREGDDQRGLKIVVEAGLLKFIDYYPASAGGQRQENIIQTDQIQANHWHHAAIVINARADVQDYGFCAVLDGQVIDALPGAHLVGAIAPLSIGGLTFTPVIDPVATNLLASDPAVVKTGSWHTTADGYLHDRGKLKGEKALTFPVSQPSGVYRLLLNYPADNPLAPRYANNVPVEITHGGGQETRLIDLRQGGTQPFELGVFELVSGESQVTVQTTDTEGLVAINGLQLVPLHYQDVAVRPTPIETSIQPAALLQRQIKEIRIWEAALLQGQIKEIRIWEAARSADDLWQTRHDITDVAPELREHLLFHWDISALPNGLPESLIQPLRLLETQPYSNLSPTISLVELAAIAELYRETEVPIERLTVLWSGLRYFGNGDNQTLFDTLFNPRGIADDNRWLYTPSQPRLWQVGSIEPDARAIRSRLMAALRVSQTDLELMVAAVSQVKDLSTLSAVVLDGPYLTQLYRLRLLATLLKLSVADTLTLMDRLQQEVELNDLANLTLANVITLRERVQWMQESGIDLAESEFLVYDQPDRRVAPPFNDGSVIDTATDLLAQVQTILLTPTGLVSEDPIISDAGSRAVYADLLPPDPKAAPDAQAQEITLTLPMPDSSDLQEITVAVILPTFEQYDNLQAIATAMGQSPETLTAQGVGKAITLRLRALRRDVDASLLNALATLLDTTLARLEAIIAHTKGKTFSKGTLNSAKLLEELNAIAASRTFDRKSDLAKDLAQLYKTLFLLSQFDLSLEEIETLLTQPEVFGLTPGALLTPSQADLASLHDFVQLKARLNDPGNRLLEIMQVESDQSESDQSESNVESVFEAAIEALTDWQPSEIRTLAGALGISPASNYTTIPSLTQLAKGFSLITTLGADAAYLIELANLADADFATYRRQADTLLDLLRAKYTEDQRPKVFEPIHERLSTQQRDSLTAVALEQLGDRITGRKSADVLYEYLLIDVQTSSAVQTSRIVQATAALQLYVQRCLMNLERGVDPSAIPADEWLWMKNYRVWEANRKVFLYPENFIEPELRDTKTPLFEELESELQQSDVDKDSAAAVYTRYLDRFAEIANLTIVGSYLDTEELAYQADPDERKATLYLVGRNEATEEYYLRSMVQDGKVIQWKPWEKIDVPINAKFVSPVVAFNKLFLFWAESQDSFITEDRKWLNRTLNSNGVYDLPIDQLGDPIALQRNTKLDDNIFDTAQGSSIINDTDIDNNRNAPLISQFDAADPIDFTIGEDGEATTKDSDGNEVFNLTYQITYNFVVEHFIAGEVRRGSRSENHILIGENARRFNPPRTKTLAQIFGQPTITETISNVRYTVVSFQKRLTLFPQDAYNDLDGGFINEQTFVVNDKHGVVSQVNRPVKQPIIKYTYYNFSRTWVQPQTYLQLDVKLDEWRQRQPKWQRIYAQRWRESLGESRQRDPEPISNLQVTQLGPNSYLERPVPNAFSTANLTVSFWLRANQFAPTTTAQPERPPTPAPFELFSYGNGALRTSLSRQVGPIGEEPQMYQAVDNGRAGLLDVRAAIAALQRYNQSPTASNRTALNDAYAAIDPANDTTAVGQANQAAGQIASGNEPARQLTVAVVNSATAARAAIDATRAVDDGTLTPTAAAQLVIVSERAIDAATAALAVINSTEGVPSAASEALITARSASDNLATYTALDPTAAGTVTFLINAGRLTAPAAGAAPPSIAEVTAAISTAIDQFTTALLTSTLSVLDTVQPNLNNAEQFQFQVSKWELTNPTLSLTLGTETQVLLTLSTSDVNNWRHIALILNYQTNAYGVQILSHSSNSNDSGTNHGSLTFSTAQLGTGQTLQVGAPNNPESNLLPPADGATPPSFSPLQPWMSEFRLWGTVRSQAEISRDRFDQQNGDTATLLHLPLDRQQSSTSQLLLVSGTAPLLSLRRIFPVVTFSEARERLLLLYGDVRTTATEQADGIVRTFRNNFADRRFSFFLSPNPSNYRDLSLTETATPYIGIEARQGSLAENYAANQAIPLERYAPDDRQRIQRVEGILPLPGAIVDELDNFSDNTANQILLQDSSINGLIESVETSILDVHNQPGWYVLDIGDGQFLVKVDGNNDALPRTAEQRLDYVDPNQIQGTAAVNVGLRYVPDALLNRPNLTIQFDRLNTFAVQSLSDRLFAEGIDGLLSLASQSLGEPNFNHLSGSNATNFSIQGPNDNNIIDFNGSYGIYYWEIFFHIPFLIANQLNANQKFEEAQKWYHYIFDPTAQEEETLDNPNDRYWRFRPFRGLSVETLSAILTNGDALKTYREDPFDPHAIARLRINAYQKAVVMKYIDNLLDWGDNLFRQDSRESINEAVLLYVLAFNLLGPRPKATRTRPFETVGDYRAVVGDLERSNIEELPDFLANATAPSTPPNLQIPFNPHRTVATRFCTPENAQFVGYWDRVEDRLYKIRHSLNIDGVFRSLALFQPPIDPAALVNAVAGGGLAGALASGIASGSQPVPHYRYGFMIEKAKEMTNTVIGLGSALLDTLEKKDAEALTLLLHSHEQTLLDLNTDIKRMQISATEASLRALEQGLASAQDLYNRYDARIQEYLSPLEITQIGLTGTSLIVKAVGTVLQFIAAGTGAIPQITVGGSGAFGSPVATVEAGGDQASKVSERGAAAVVNTADIIAGAANIIGMFADYERRRSDWEQQRDQADFDMKQIREQIAEASLQISIAKRDLAIHQRTIEQQKEVGAFYRQKFTNQDLYNWMCGRLSGLYFQTYKLAYDLAKQAERAYQFEFGATDTYISFGHWDSRRRGLLAGEALMLDLSRLEKSALDQDSRYLEITKPISLLRLDPEAFLDLKTTGRCQFRLNELLFDRDFPGHYFRIIKSVSISIPAVVGPYQTVKATLTQTGHQTLLAPDIGAVEFLLGDNDGTIPDSIRADWRANQQIALSTGVDDSGVFELNFNDDRYLPFEGTGAVSNWLLEMPLETNAIDFDTVSDVVINLRYMCKTDGGQFKQQVMELDAVKTVTGTRLFSVAHEFAAQWHAFINDDLSVNTLDLRLPANAFPPNIVVDRDTVVVEQLFAQTVDGSLEPVTDQFENLPLPLDTETQSTFNLTTNTFDKGTAENLWVLVTYGGELRSGAAG